MELSIVDAFTDKAFSGNPAAVVLLTEDRPDSWMQSVAAEMNLSETAFIRLGSEPKSLRWFTPTTEVPLCGHATLASAHVLGGDQTFSTKSGLLTCRSSDGWVEMDFPANPGTAAESDGNLGAGLPGLKTLSVSRAGELVLVQAESEADVRSLTPDFDALLRIPAQGVLVTAPADDESIDFVSRCFYPSVGVPEDPVTGSAHCALACWWADRLGKTELIGKQISQRSGIVRMSLHGDRVTLSGQAHTVLKGELVD